MNAPDPYEVIGVRRDASLDEIRIAYRRSAQVLHPDRFGTASEAIREEAARRMRELNEAMESIEAERVDEVSGTGILGPIALGTRTTGWALPPISSAPVSDAGAAPPREAPLRPLRPIPTPAAAPTPPPAPAPSEPEEDDAMPVPYQPPAVDLVPERAWEPPPTVEEDTDDEDAWAERMTSRRSGHSGRPTGRAVLIPGLVLGALLVGLIAYALVGQGSGSSGEKTFEHPGVLFSFRYPRSYAAQKPSGGAARQHPSFQAMVGPDREDFLLASTYPLNFQVLNDGSATGAQGQRITADQLNRDVDAAVAQVGAAAKMVPVGGYSQRTIGGLPARVYEYRKRDNSLFSTFVVAFKGNTEYFLSCQRRPADKAAIEAACSRMLDTFQAF
jgi:hypothetical protein